MVNIYYYTGALSGVVQVITGSQYIKCTLYNTLVKNAMHGNDYMLSTNTEVFNPYVLSAIIFDKKYVPLYRFDQYSEFIEIFQTPILNDLCSGSKEIITTLKGQNIFFNFWQTYDKPRLTRKNLYNDALMYEPFSTTEASAFLSAACRTAFRSIADMEKESNCAWIFAYDSVDASTISPEQGTSYVRENLESDSTEEGSVSNSLERFGLSSELNQILSSVNKLENLPISDSGNMEHGSRHEIKNFSMIATQDELEELYQSIQDLPDGTLIGFDVLTNGDAFHYMPDMPAERSSIIGISISASENTAVYVPFRGADYPVFDMQKVLSRIHPQLKRLKVVTYDSKFLWRAMYASGFSIGAVEDIKLLDFNIYTSNEEKQAHTLIWLCNFFLSERPWTIRDLSAKKIGKGILEYAPADIIRLYGNIGSCYALKLYHVLIKYLNPEQTYPYKLDCNIVELIGKAEYYGICLDRALLRENRTKLMIDQMVLESLMDKYIRTEGWNVYLEQQLVRRYDRFKESYPDSSDEELLEMMNTNYDSFLEDSLRVFDSKIGKILTGRSVFTSTQSLSLIMYEVLGYPILMYNNLSKKQREADEARKAVADAMGKPFKPTPRTPSTNAAALDLLESYVLSEPNILLKKDIESALGGVLVLANRQNSKNGVNWLQYPFAYMLKIYRKITKLLSSFYAKNCATDSPYLYTELSMTGADTARVTGAVQTIAGNCKKMVKAYPGYNCINADMAQAEFRTMFGEANKLWGTLLAQADMAELSIHHRDGLKAILNSLNNPESDIHRETGSLSLGVKPEEITSAQRHDIKATNFSVPYGAEVYSLSAADLVRYLDRLNPSDVENLIIADHGLTKNKWSFCNYPLHKYLETKRREPFKELAPDDIVPPYLEGLKVGYVANALGRRRWFKTDVLNSWEFAAIERAAGNYPIQSYARELFFIHMLNMYNDAKRLGWVKNPEHGEIPQPDKFMMNAYVHDEQLGNFRDIHPYDIIKLIYRNCFVQYPGHPVYYMGINFVNTWYDGKSGDNELPVLFVYQLVQLEESQYPGFKENKLWYKDIGIEIPKWFELLIKDYKYRRVQQEIANVRATLIRGEECTETIEEVKEYWHTVADTLTSYYVRPLIKEFCEVLFNEDTSGMDLAGKIQYLSEHPTYDFFEEYRMAVCQNCETVKDGEVENIGEMGEVGKTDQRLSTTNLFGNASAEGLVLTADSTESIDFTDSGSQLSIDHQEMSGSLVDSEAILSPQEITELFGDLDLELRNQLSLSLDLVSNLGKIPESELSKCTADAYKVAVLSPKDIREMVHNEREEQLCTDYFNLGEYAGRNSIARGREDYIMKNQLPQDVLDTRVIINLSGTTILDFTKCNPAQFNRILCDIKQKFYDPNGVLLKIRMPSGIKTANFRIMYPNKDSLLAVMDAYPKMPA